MTMAGRTAAPELLIERSFAAPREAVFALWTSCAHLGHWWGPKDFAMTSCDWDFRVDGAWRTVIRSAAMDEHAMHGIFREIAAPERLAFTFRWEEPDALETLVTVTLAERDGRTSLAFHQTPFASEAARDSHVEGWSQCLDKLVGAMP